MARFKSLRPSLSHARPRFSVLVPDYDGVRRDTHEYRRWYNTARWRRMRWDCLVRDAFTCRMCGLIEADTSRLVADHIRPHRGDERMFWDEANLQCLCATCHSSAKQSQEAAAGR